MPAPLFALLKRVAVPVFEALPPALAYRARVAAERVTYLLARQHRELPPIFHYWSNKFLKPRLERLGFASPEQFFRARCLAYAAREPERRLRIASLGAGRCELELDLAEQVRAAGFPLPDILCIDLNGSLLREGQARARARGLERAIRVQQLDLNLEFPRQRFDLVLANQSLHHIDALESLLDAIADALGRDGSLLTADVIGRNGHRLWPEARRALEPFWDELPLPKRFDHTLDRPTTMLVDHDHSTVGFEGVRCQELLPLLAERFQFSVFAPHSCLTIPLLERRYGWNFDAEAEWDRDFVDRLDAADQTLLASGTLKPTQLVAECGAGLRQFVPIAPWAQPAACVRQAEHGRSIESALPLVARAAQ
jgi:SAM-dependent methyltransferase